MAGDSTSGGTVSGRDGTRVALDTSTAHPARVYDYWLGGKDNFEVDRDAARLALDASPGIIEGIRANRAFLGRAVRYLAGEALIRQFLDIGTGLPTADNTHEVAQAIAPECRVVYADNDPIVLAHARALLTSTGGVTAYVDADIRDTAKILKAAARTLDFDKPVAIMLLTILQLIPDSDDPHTIVARLVEAVPSGSYLVISHPTGEIDSEAMTEAARRLNERSAAQMTLRTHAEISRFFDGLKMVEPGLVPVNRWRPAPGDIDQPRNRPNYCAVAVKP
ncbi:MAG: SAM-dependent methyltransferase [Micromonosporaceae bacterium]